MKQRLKENYPILLILLISLMFAKLHFNKRSGNEQAVCATICGDARGYYAWLPALFIYNDLNFKFYDSVEFNSKFCGNNKDVPMLDYRKTFEGKTMDKYYPGASFMILPFFFLAHYYTIFFSHQVPDGYSFYYFKLVPLAAFFYYFLGMLFFSKLLGKLQLNNWQKSLVILLLTFGSNLIYYTIDAPVYSHIYSFALIAAFLYLAFSLKELPTVKNISLISFITGLIFITRPVNLSILFILPFIFAGNLKVFTLTILRQPKLLLSLVPVLFMPVLLFSLYKTATGHYFVYSYDQEGFDFLHPHFWQFLIHYDNGLFTYMPLLAMPFLFIFAWYRKENKAIVAGVAFTLLVTIYVQSSWWCWYYGYSFGARTMLDFLPLFGIPLAFSIKNANLKKHFYLLPVYAFCCVCTLILYQQKSANHMMSSYPIKDYWQAIGNPFGLR
jgi:hypothetical protein